MTMKTILQVIPTLNSGGAERTTIDMARAIEAAGWRTIVASSGGRLASQVEHVTLPLASKNPLVIIANAFRLRKLIKREKIDLVHVRSRAPAWSLYLARIPFIATYHGLYKAQNPAKRFYNAVMTKGLVTIANSAHTAAHIKAEHGDVKTIVIDRGVDLETFTPKANDKRFGEGFVVFMPARLGKGKGHKIAIDALLKLQNVTLVFAGDGDDTALKAYAKERGVTPHFAGHIADMAGAIAASDLIIAPTTVPESFGRVPLEAGAMAKPVIVSDLGGLKYTVIDQVTGWLCPVGDAETLAMLITSVQKLTPEARDLVGQAAYKHITKNFSLTRMTEKTLVVYRKF
jgi:glycosyltransferase involved in cell wall biosynthesis